MKTSFILCLLLLAGALSARAQSPGNGRLPTELRKKKSAEDTKTKALEAATSLYKAVPDDVKSKAKEMLTSPAAADARQRALQAAQGMIQNNGGSLPAAAAAAIGSQPPATPAPVEATPATPVTNAPPPPPAGPQPKPLQPLNLDEAPRATKGQIVVTAQKNAFFDANKGYGIYVGDVKARHPQMYIECEELELFMTQQPGGMLGAGKTAPPSKDADIVAPSKKGDEGPPIEKADARGPMVTVEKISEDGELQIGRCKHLIYDGKTKITTLLEWPQVQAGNKLHKATEPGCVMTIDQKGTLTTKGGHQTIILQGDDATPKSRSGTIPAQQ